MMAGDVAAFTVDELRELSAGVAEMTRSDGHTSANLLLKAARVLELAAEGDLQVIRCTCELFGVASCPVC